MTMTWAFSAPSHFLKVYILQWVSVSFRSFMFRLAYCKKNIYLYTQDNLQQYSIEFLCPNNPCKKTMVTAKNAIRKGGKRRKLQRKVKQK